MSHAVDVIAFITALPGQEALVGQALKIAEQETQTEPGCEVYRLTRDLDNPSRYVMIERWRSLDDLQTHKQSAAFTRLAAVIGGKADLDVTVTHTVS